MDTMILVGIGIVIIWALSYRITWVIAIGLGALASTFACLASIIHFQILAAVGLFVLASILWIIQLSIIEG